MIDCKCILFIARLYTRRVTINGTSGCPRGYVPSTGIKPRKRDYPRQILSLGEGHSFYRERNRL